MPSFKIVTQLIIFALVMLVSLGIYFAFLTPGLSLDFTLSKGHLIAVMSAYTAEDIQWHRFGTAVLDSALPVAYTLAGLFALRRYAQGTLRLVFSGMLLAGMSVDFWENAMNLQMLSGDFSQVDAHVWATRAKFVLLLPPLGWALVQWLREASARRQGT